MRIAIISDVHGNLPALEAVVADIRGRGVDMIVNLGDTVSGPLLPRETAQFLMAEDWLTIAGNHERQLLAEPADGRGPSDAYARACLDEAQLRWLAGLPKRARPEPDVLLLHGTLSSDLDYLLETVDPPPAGATVTRVRPRLATAEEIAQRLCGETAALVACGHSHVPRALRTSRGQLLVDPGSVGLPAFTATTPHPHVVETGSPDARYAIVERGARGWSAALRSVPYNYAPMAALARERERTEWALALSTGYVGI